MSSNAVFPRRSLARPRGGVRRSRAAVGHARLGAYARLGCDVAQGYHVSRPLTAAAFAAWPAVGPQVGRLHFARDPERPGAPARRAQPAEIAAR